MQPSQLQPAFLLPCLRWQLLPLRFCQRQLQQVRIHALVDAHGFRASDMAAKEVVLLFFPAGQGLQQHVMWVLLGDAATALCLTSSGQGDLTCASFFDASGPPGNQLQGLQ